MEVLHRMHITQHVIIQSFDMRSLQYLHLHYPEMQASLLVDEGDTRSFEEEIRTLGFTPTIYSPHYSLVTNKLLTDCHQKNVRVIPWTINGLPEMKKLKAMGVDGLISDYPDLYENL